MKKNLNEYFTQLLLYSLLLSTVFLSANRVYACIVFGQSLDMFDTKDSSIISRNFDYPIGGRDGLGMILFNPKGVYRSSIKTSQNDNPVVWQSRYSSLTLNLLSPQTPQDGMNSEGLMASVTVIRGRVHFPQRVDQPSLTEMEILQFVLDQAATAQEAIDLIVDRQDKKLSYEKGYREFFPKVKLVKLSNLYSSHGEINLHWTFCDAHKCATIDNYPSGWEVKLIPVNKMIITNEDTENMDNKYNKLATDNEIAREILPFEQKYVTREVPQRYCNARFFSENPDVLAHDVQANKSEIALNLQESSYEQPEINFLENQFYLLERTTAASWNKWQMIYQPQKKTFYYRTKKNNFVQKIEVENILKDLESHTKVLGLSLHSYSQIISSDFRELKTDSHIKDVVALMGQSSKTATHIIEHLEEQNTYHERTRANASLADFRSHMTERFQEVPENNGFDSKWGMLNATAKILYFISTGTTPRM